MQLRGRRMLFDVEDFGYFLVRFLLKDVQVEYSTASIGKFRHERHQHFFGNTASGFGNTCFIRNVGQSVPRSPPVG